MPLLDLQQTLCPYFVCPYPFDGQCNLSELIAQSAVPSDRHQIVTAAEADAFHEKLKQSSAALRADHDEEGSDDQQPGLIDAKYDLDPSKEPQVGPIDFIQSSEDPLWNLTEPYSSTELKFVAYTQTLFDTKKSDRERTTSHAEIQDFMADRYILTPSKLYEIVRLGTDKSTYEVPLVGDWVMFATIAEKKDVQSTQPRPHAKANDKSQSESAATSSSKFLSCKLVDFGNGFNHTGSDILNLLFFESDQGVQEGEGRIFRGGSKGAFERWWKLPTGTLIAILNPKLMRPSAEKVRQVVLHIVSPLSRLSVRICFSHWLDT